MENENKRPIGRPSELTPELIEKAREYLRGGYSAFGDLVPSIAGLACYLGKSRSTVNEYAKQNDEFSDTLEGVKTLQENKLLNGGLSGEFNSTITKLMLANHGYADKSDVNQNGTMNHNITPPLSTLFEND